MSIFRVYRTGCQFMVAFTCQNWHFKKCQEKYSKPNFCIDICINRTYLEYFYKIYLPSMCFWRESAGLYCFLCTLSISCPVHVAAPQMAYRPFEVSRSASKQALKVILSAEKNYSQPARHPLQKLLIFFTKLVFFSEFSSIFLK